MPNMDHLMLSKYVSILRVTLEKSLKKHPNYDILYAMIFVIEAIIRWGNNRLTMRSAGWSWRLELEYCERKILLVWLELELVAAVV